MNKDKITQKLKELGFRELPYMPKKNGSCVVFERMFPGFEISNDNNAYTELRTITVTVASGMLGYSTYVRKAYRTGGSFDKDVEIKETIRFYKEKHLWKKLLSDGVITLEDCITLNSYQYEKVHHQER